MPTERESHHEAMGLREAIGQAVSLLQEQHDIGEAAAFGMLIHGTSDSAEQVRDVAAAIVDQAAHPTALGEGPDDEVDLPPPAAFSR